MTIESLGSEIAVVIDDCNNDFNVGMAALNDFMRALHEVFTKSSRSLVEIRLICFPKCKLSLAQQWQIIWPAFCARRI